MTKISLSEKPESLRDCLDVIEMLLRSEFGHDLWNVLVALRGPDTRDRGLKYATTCVIRQHAFPGRPTEGLSVFKDDCKVYAKRRSEMFETREGLNHFREHIGDAFDSLDLKIGEVNEQI